MVCGYFLTSSHLSPRTPRWWLMVPALTVGIWIKFVPVLLVPFFALWWWQDVDKQTWKKPASNWAWSDACRSITVLSWRPYWVGPQVFASVISQAKFASMSIFATIYYSLKPLFVWLLADQAHWYLTRLVQGSLLMAFVYMLYPIIKNVLPYCLKKQN